MFALLGCVTTESDDVIRWRIVAYEWQAKTYQCLDQLAVCKTEACIKEKSEKIQK